MPVYVFLSHDVDWPIQGAPRDHVLARRDRFSKSAIENLEKANPYYNIPRYMEIEEAVGIRSTWFFRTHYPTGKIEDYESVMQDLVKSGWEVGLHLEPERIEDPLAIRQDKHTLETILKHPVRGNRVHYAKYSNALMSNLKAAGFLYDSSKVFNRELIKESSMGVYSSNGILEFPITIVDAFMFTHMKLQEDQVIATINQIIQQCRESPLNHKIITLIWHNCVLQMKGGRIYPRIVETLMQEDDLKILRGLDLAKLIGKAKAFEPRLRRVRYNV